MKATQEQINAWKAQHGDMYEVEVDGHYCYLKKPSRKALGYASVAGKSNPIKFNEILLNDCWVGGDEAIKTEDDLFLAVSGQLAELISVKEAALAKL